MISTEIISQVEINYFLRCRCVSKRDAKYICNLLSLLIVRRGHDVDVVLAVRLAAAGAWLCLCVRPSKKFK